MEDNNSFLIKTIAGALILILALNVYRTESTKKQMDRLAATVDSLSVRMDALEYPDFSDIGLGTVQNVDNKAVADLAKGLTQLQSKVTALQGKVDNISCNPSSDTKGTAASAGSGKDVSDLAKSISDLQTKVNAMQKTVDRLSSGQQRQASSNQGSSATASAQPSSGSKASSRVSVSAKVKVEDRYVSGRTPVPSITNGPTGVVVIGVTMDRVGIVSKATVNSGTTITDEEILDACKEAALKTSFGYNPEAPNHSIGTITYTFTAR
jgi:hypothetical protein